MVLLTIVGIILIDTSFQKMELSESIEVNEIVNDTLVDSIIKQEPKNKPPTEPIDECNVCIIQDSHDFLTGWNFSLMYLEFLQAS